MPKSGKARFLTLIPVAMGALLLAACVSGRPEPDTYTSLSGTVTTIETDRDLCIRACNDEYARCGDMLASTRSDVGSSPMPKTFGVSAECRDALRDCLPRCKGR